jgi:hypothetical protein
MKNCIAHTVVAILCVARIAGVSAQPQREAEAYAVLFSLTFHGTPASTMVVKDVAVRMPTVSGAGADWLTQFDDVPAALRSLVRQAAPTLARPLNATLFPSGTQLISEQAISQLFAGGVEPGWSALRQHYGSGLLSVSEMLFTPDGLDALVYYDAHCGGLCGESAYLWLHRSATQGPWSINKRIVRSMS